MSSELAKVCWRCGGSGFRSIEETMGSLGDWPCPACHPEPVAPAVRFIGVDYGTAPAVILTETYSRDGKHLGTVVKSEDGTVLYEEGPRDSKDTIFIPSALRIPIPETEKS